MVTQIIGWIGATLLLSAYALLSAKKVEPMDISYQSLNLAASITLLISAIGSKAYPFVLLNIIWAIIAVTIISRGLLKK